MTESVEAVSWDPAYSTRLASEWLGVPETSLSEVPGWAVDAIASRLAQTTPEAALRTELLERLGDTIAGLYQQAHTDELTGLANRRAIAERLADELARAQRYGRDVTVFLLDVDGLKAINDRDGHASGDRVIRAVGQRIASIVRATDLCGRWGGDEFAVICPETAAAAAVVLARKLSHRLTWPPLTVPDRDDPIGVSIGWGSDGSTGDAGAVLAAADRSLYEAKSLRKRAG